MPNQHIHLVFGWSFILLGVLSGGIVGLFFHRANWVGGYTSFRRRMLRLGHISFLGMGLLNLALGLTLKMVPIEGTKLAIASVGFLIGAFGMPICCFLTAWKKQFRHLFFLPVFAITLGILLLLVEILAQ